MSGGDGRDPWIEPSSPVERGQVERAEMERSARGERAVHRQLMRFGEGETLATPVWEAPATSVREIEAQLARLWPAREGDTDRDSPRVTEKGLAHARASVLNLIVTAPDAAAADRVVATMMGLGTRHPSRAIVLVADPAAKGAPIDARISVHCQTAPQRGNRICYEQVVLTVRGEASHHLSGVVAPLLIHDLPIHVWWPGDPPFEDPIFDQLVEMSDRLIVDSSDFSDLLTGYRRLSTLRRRAGVGDLSWERLAWWHEVTAEFFDNPRFRRYLPNLSRLQIRYAAPSAGGRSTHRPEEVAPGVAAPITQAMLSAGWLASRLGWRRYRTAEPAEGGRIRLLLEGRYEMVDLDIAPVEDERLDNGELVSIRLRALGEAGAAEFIIDRRPGDATVATNADGMTAMLRTLSSDAKNEAELLSQQLVVDRNDRVFEESLRAAIVFLAAAGWGAPPSA